MSDSWCSGVDFRQSSHRLLYLSAQESVPTFRDLCVSRMGNSIWVEREGHSLTLTFQLMIYEPKCNAALCDMEAENVLSLEKGQLGDETKLLTDVMPQRFFSLQS